MMMIVATMVETGHQRQSIRVRTPHVAKLKLCLSTKDALEETNM